MRDGGRFALALLFALTFFLTVLIALAVAVWGSSEARTTVNGLLPVLLPAELTLLMAATGWYFAGDRHPPGA